MLRFGYKNRALQLGPPLLAEIRGSALPWVVLVCGLPCADVGSEPGLAMGDRPPGGSGGDRGGVRSINTNGGDADFVSSSGAVSGDTRYTYSTGTASPSVII